MVPQGVQLKWTDNSAVEDGYEVWVATTCTESPEFPFASVPVNSTAYTGELPDVFCGVIEWYYVVATKDGGYSDYSNSAPPP